jgi:NitT/TauT family transport system substrate-binding protein
LKTKPRLLPALGTAAVVSAMLFAAGCGGASGEAASTTGPTTAKSEPAKSEKKDVVRVGIGPFISYAGVWVALERGYFEQANLDVKLTSYADGSLIVPPLLAGDLDIGGVTLGAGTFNSMAKGAPFKFTMPGAQEKEGTGSVAINVSKALADSGVKSISDLAKLKGKKIGITAPGSINQYTMGLALQKAGLDPRKDVEWVVGIPQPDLVKAFGQGQVDAVNLAVQFSQAAEQQGFGPVVVRGYEAAPLAMINSWVMRDDFVKDHRDAAVRFAMAYMQGVRDYTEALENPDAHKDVLPMLAKNTTLDTPDKLTTLHPWWPWINPSGELDVKAILEQQDYWADYFDLVATKVAEKDLVDPSVMKEALERLEKDSPFKK